MQSSDKVNKSKNPSWEEKVETHRERFTKIKENLQMQTVYVNENAKTHDNIKSGGKYTVIHSINNYSYEPDKKVYLQRGDNYFELLPADLVRGNVNAANVAEFKRKDNSAVKQNVLQFKDTAALESDQPQSPMPVIKWVAEVRKNLNANPQENEHSVFASRKLMKADDRINDGINDVELGLTPRTSDIDKTSMVRAMVRQVVFEILQAECPAENSAYLMNNVLGTQKIGLIDVEVSEQYKGEFIKIAKEYAEEVHVTSISPAAA